MIQITEKDDRLLLQFWEPVPNVEKDGMIHYSAESQLSKEIDISAHIERAVEAVLDRRIALLPPGSAAVSAERERCAKIAENCDPTTDLGDHIARAIRRWSGDVGQ